MPNIVICLQAPVMFKNLIQSIKKTIETLVGSPDKFSLESRIFHNFSLLIFFTLTFSTIFNFSLHLYVSAILSFSVLCIQGFSYYISRYKNRLNAAVIIAVVLANVLTAIGYFYNSGLAGGTLLLYASILFIILSISPKKQWIIWISINLAVVLGVTYSEYRNPAVIMQNYTSREEQFADNLFSYIVTVMLLYMGTVTIRNSYIKQKQLADEKNLALELLNAEKVKLFSIISHDLRTPLASVQQYFDVMAELELDAQERADLEKDLLLTIGNTQELLTNLLKWAKNQMDGATAKLKPVNLRQYLAETSELFEAIAIKKGIALTTTTESDITIKADPDMLQLVIRNLLNNAVKFTAKGGHISLKAVSEDKNCIISISDNGVGISADKQKEIFSLSTSSTRGTQNELGTGLGLVLCKDYTELQGGRIWFNSIEGQGTTFYISLPCI